MNITVCWVVWLFVGLGLELWAFSDRVPGNTLSEIVWAVTKQHPMVPLMFGILAGHFFWQRTH